MSSVLTDIQAELARSLKIEKEDEGQFIEWLKIKESAEGIKSLPHSKTAERRIRSIELSQKVAGMLSFLRKYSLLEEYIDITSTLTQYFNAQIEPLEEAARSHFKELYNKDNKKLLAEPEFFTKKGGDQLGRTMRITYENTQTQKKHTVQYYIKTHQYGSKSGKSSTKPLDPKELFIYKVLEYVGLGPKVEFCLNPLSPGGFYIATQDCSFSELDEDQKFLTLDDLKNKQQENPKDTDELLCQMQEAISTGFAAADILSRLFCLRDVITNSGNSGFVLSHNKYEFKIIDFIVETRFDSYFSDRLFAGYKSGNGAFNYNDDSFLKKYLILEGSDKTKIAQDAAQKFFLDANKTLLEDAIKEAHAYVYQYVSERRQSLKISIDQDPKHPFNRYVTESKLNLDHFLNDLKAEVHALQAPSEAQAAGTTVSSGAAHLPQYRHVIQQDLKLSASPEGSNNQMVQKPCP